MSQWTARRVIKKFEKEGVEVPSPLPGRSNKLSKVDETAFVLSVKRNPQEPFAYHQDTLLQATVDVCLNTFRKYLKIMVTAPKAYDHYQDASKLLLTITEVQLLYTSHQQNLTADN
ncbi:hypothetical protein RMATCC62417_05399 [Rhizopus microsporus]|nr:hypothetical protein RMATCC62417_05399 [Rhizopus microsporus]